MVRISNYIPPFCANMITYPYRNLSAGLANLRYLMMSHVLQYLTTVCDKSRRLGYVLLGVTHPVCHITMKMHCFITLELCSIYCCKIQWPSITNSRVKKSPRYVNTRGYIYICVCKCVVTKCVKCLFIDIASVGIAPLKPSCSFARPRQTRHVIELWWQWNQSSASIPSCVHFLVPERNQNRFEIMSLCQSATRIKPIQASTGPVCSLINSPE